MLIPVNDIIILDPAGKVLNYSCQVSTDEPLKCGAAVLRKHMINEITRMIYSGTSEVSIDELTECIKRRLSTLKKVEVIKLSVQ